MCTQDKSTETESRLALASLGVEREMGSDCLIGTGFSFGVMKIPRNRIEVMVETRCDILLLKCRP